MSRLYWSNLPDAKRPRGKTSILWSSLTTEDLPIPEYPETSTNCGAPPVTTRLKEGKQGIDLSRSSVQFLGNQQLVGNVVLPQRESLDFIELRRNFAEFSRVSHSSRRGPRLQIVLAGRSALRLHGLRVYRGFSKAPGRSAFPFYQAVSKITLSAGRRLVSFFRRFASSFIMIPETGAGIFSNCSLGATGFLAM